MRTHARLQALERQSRRDPTITIWHQADDGRDAYTSAKHPGLVLTHDQVQARPEPLNGLRIIVHYVRASPAARQPGERF